MRKEHYNSLRQTACVEELLRSAQERTLHMGGYIEARHQEIVAQKAATIMKEHSSQLHEGYPTKTRVG
eukprot:12903808-Prorocentrum_lima.AAC.1